MKSDIAMGFIFNGVTRVCTRYWAVITMVLLFAISALSLWPADHLPDISGSDKLHHLLAYAALSVPVSVAKPRFWILTIGIFVIWSGAIELIQPYVNRYGEWLDLAANVSGVLIGIVIAALVIHLNHRFQLS